MNLKRSLALAISVLMILTMPFAFGAGETLDRIAGSDRWETAVKICQEGWDSASTVVLANGRNYPDALAGVTLAYALDAPVLLTEADSLVAATKAEITRLGAGKVVILGGTGVISENVEKAIKDMGLEVERIKGADRFETAAAIAAKVAPTGCDTVVLASGRGYADALAAASYAAINGYPILLTEKNSLPPATKKAIEDLGATNVIVVGGTGVIADSAIAGLPGVKRVSGANREATSVALAEHFALETNMYYLATGDGFADAITGAVLAAKEGTGILLVRAAFPAVVGDFFTEAEVIEAVIFGGTGAIKEAVATAAAKKLVPAMGTGVAGITTKGATVTVGKISVVADKDTGAYQVTGLAPGEHTVTLSMAKFSPVSKPVKVYKDNISVLDFVLGEALLKTSINIGGAVIDTSTQRPLAGVAVAVEQWNAKDGKWVTATVTTAATGDNGTFAISNGDTGTLDFGDKVRITLTKDKYHEIQQTLTLKTDAVDHQLDGAYMTPVKKMDIAGKITDANGDVAGATVQLLTAKGAAITGAVATTDAKGLYKIADQYLLSGAYGIKVSKTNYANTVASISISEGVNLTYNAVLQPGYTVTFKLGADALDGKFAEGAFEAALYRAGVKYADGVMTTIADWPAAELEFKFEGELVAPGTYTLRVTGDHLLQKDFTVTVVNKNITNYGSAAFAGTITGTVPGGAKVELLNEAGSVVATQDVAAAGNSYTFRNLAAGKYRVRVSKAGYQTAVSPVATVDPQPLAVNETVKIDVATLIDNPTQGINAGTVYTAGTLAPIGGATVTYYYTNVVNPSTGELFKDTSTVYTAGGTGLYNGSSEKLYPGVYTVVVRATGHETQSVERTVVAGDNYDTLNYFLQTGGDATLTLEVKDKNKNAVTSGFTLTDAWGQAAGTGSVFETNKYQFTGLAAGTYELKIVCTGHEDVKVPVIIARSAAVTRAYNLTAVPAKYDVNVGIRGADNVAVDGARVVVTNAAGKVVATGTTAVLTGQVALKLADGTYKIAFHKSGMMVAQTSVTVNKPTVAINLPWVTIYSW